ncbi:VanW family protein [Actinoplanes sp. NPDC026619]|uniref:VanW family protein n=1 Tax=Actinoplanes sp. NPDC026619 TaxID=3155798 RepID=UPI00340C3D12
MDATLAGTVYEHHRRWYARLWVLIVAALVVVIVAAVVATVVMTRPAVRVPAGRAVAGVPIGGLDERELRAAVESSVRARVEQPVTVRVTGADRTFTLQPATAGISLDADATVREALAGAETAAVTVDAAKLRAVLAAQKQAATDTVVKLATPKPRLEAKGDASFTASAAGVDRTAGTAGWAVDEATAAPAVEAAVRAGRAEVSIAGAEVAPGTTPAELAGVDQLIGTFTTYHPCCAPRVTNIHLIATIVDGSVIKPGTTFSLNDKVGERTRKKGFVPAPAIVDGELDDELGGGISQFSTTLFNAAWFAGLPILAHQPHSKYISRYPPGREATLDWGNIDQVIRNDTDAPVVIRVKTTGTSVTVALYGHTGERRVASVTGARTPAGAEGGFSIRVTRTVYDDTRQTGTATLRWTYSGLD